MIYPIRTIVAGIAVLGDGDPLLPQVLELARRTGADLHLVHTYDLPTTPWDAYAPFGLLNGETVQQFGDAIRNRLEGRARVMGLERVVCHTRPGPPASAIAEIAGRQKADLIVVGATRHRMLVRMLLGTTAQRVLRQAGAPVLVVRRPVPARIERVLVATDLSEFSAGIHEAGLDVVESLFSGEAPEVRALYVLDNAARMGAAVTRARLEGFSSERLREFLALRRERSVPVAGMVRCGDPATEIVTAVDEWRADLLIVGKNEDPVPMRWVLGSAAESSTRDASCNVLVIPSCVEVERMLPVPWATAHPYPA